MSLKKTKTKITDNTPVNETETEVASEVDDVREDAVVLYQPISLLFFAAVFGILFDKYFSATPQFWLILSIIFFLLSLISNCKNGWRVISDKVVFKFTRLDTQSQHRGAVVQGRSLLPIPATVFVLLFCFSIFGYWHNDRWNKFASNDLGFYATEEGYPVGVRAVVSDLPRLLPPVPDNFLASEERTIFTVSVQKLRDGENWRDATGNVFVTINGDCTDLMVGNEVLIFGELSKPAGKQNLDDVDYAGKLRSQRILCVINGKGREAVSVISGGKISVAKILGIVRHAASKNLYATMPPETALLASAMLLGLRDGVDEQVRQNLIDTGTMHILAISGLHVVVVTVCFRYLFFLFGFGNRAMAVLTVFIVAQYLLLTNMAPPAIRATALITVISIAGVTGRRAYGINSFCATAIFILILNPTELFQFGSQLSYIATAAFFWIPKRSFVMELLDKWILRKEKISSIEKLELLEQRSRDNSILYNLVLRFLFTLPILFIVSLIIWVISTPLILERIHVFAPIAILVNMFLWFPLYAAMINGFIAMLTGSIPFVGDFFGMSTDFFFNMLFGMIAFFQWLGGHYWTISFPVWWNIGFYAGFIFVTIIPFRRLSLFVILLFVVIWFFVGIGSFVVSDVFRYYSDELTMDVFAVGHGNCVLIATPSKKLIVYDVGCITSSRRAANTLSRGVWSLGKMKIDAVMISHPDSDHFNGLAKVIERFEVGVVLVSPYMFLQPADKEHSQSYDAAMQLKELLQKRGIPIIEVGEGDDLSKYGLPNTTIIHPPKRGFTNKNSNASSLVLRFEHRGVSALLPADLDNVTNTSFFDRRIEQVDIMMIPHHGGKSDATEPLLERTTPKLLIISDGGFTNRAISIENYRKRNFIVHSTRDNGFIKIKINKNNCQIIKNTPQ
ncbi:MAG: ComEC/Rec2 family competence protein [Planctomycetaceae bacterium]|jgi:competence protein ComEC|nr:ComEC/Rec2 family competence protein [Planctomycetaceae bacterium]